MRSILQRQYEHAHIFNIYPGGNNTVEDFKKYSPKKKQKIELICGHFKYGIHTSLGIYDCFYITLLRKPVDRVISHYYYVKKDKNHPLHQKLNNEKMNIRDYLTAGLTKELDNGQSRLLAGDEGYIPEFGKCTTEVLEAAKRNLRQDFKIVGTTERFDETLLLLKAVLGWKMPFYSRKNVAQKKDEQSFLTSDVYTFLEDSQHIDQELYSYADKLLDQMLYKHVKFLKVKLYYFRILNFFYNCFLYLRSK